MANWARDDEQIDMGLSETGWDSEMVNYPHVFELDGRTHMLYQGNGMGATASAQPYWRPRRHGDRHELDQTREDI